MDFGSSQVYTFEVYSASGTALADISQLCFNRVITLERNEAETLRFDMDLFAFEAFCKGINADPKTIIAPYQTDIKIKRNGQLWYGFHIVDVDFNMPADNVGVTTDSFNGTAALQQTFTVTATGYLNLFKDRYVTQTYTAQDAAYIAGNLITQAQAATRGSVGATISGTSYMTGVNRDRTYVRQNVKDGIQNLTKLVDGRFDFAFDANKVFKTYSQLGSKRTDIALTYGGDASNIVGWYSSRSALSLYNQIIALGSGFGADQLVSTQDDVTSQTNYYLRQDIKQYNSVVEQTTLDQNATADLSLEKDLLEIPQPVITGNALANVPFLNVGDRVPLYIVGHPFLSNLNGLYFRIEKMEITLDENDFESAIRLYFDNWSVT